MFVRGYDPVLFSKLPSLALLLAVGCAAESELALLAEQRGEDARAPVLGAREDAGSTNDAAREEPPLDEEFDPPATVDASSEAGALPSNPPSAGERDGGLGSYTSALVLRYDFAGSGTQVEDRVGDANAQVVGGARLDPDGQLDLDGRNDYVDLPNGVLSSLDDASIVVWFEWLGGFCWERVFDFGSNDRGEDLQGNAITSLFFTPKPCGGETRSVLMAELGGRRGTLTGTPVSAGRTTMVAVTYEGRTKQVRLYQNGLLQSQGYARFTLTQINDINSWLGRSQWIQDVFARIRYDEFRIYGSALGPDEIEELARLGPNTLR